MNSFMNEDKASVKLSYPQLFAKIWPYCRRHKVMLFVVLSAVVIAAVASRLMPTLLGYAIDEGIQKSNYSLIVKIATAYLLLEILQTYMTFVHTYYFQKLGNRILYYIRSDLIEHVQKLPITFFNKTPTGRLVTRITNDVGAIGELFTDGVINVFVHLVTLISILVAMTLISVKLTLISLCLSPLFLWWAFKLSNKIRETLHESKKRLAMINSYVAENLSGIKVVQLYNRVGKNTEKFNKLSADYKDIQIDSIHYYALLMPIMNFFNAVTIAMALYFGGMIRQENGLAIGALVAFFMHVQDILPPLREIIEKYQQFQNSLTSAERIFSLFDEKQESHSEKLQLPQQIRGAIEISHLNFRYDQHLPYVLKDINIKIRPAESLALVGRTGSGKSTFISLLQKFYEIEEGDILVDNLSIKEIQRENLRHHIGVVQQDNFIFRGNIRDNVSLGDPRITEAQIASALEQVGFNEILRKTGRTLDSNVEERGANLSVGERQLIAFARILAFDPSILILDEATSNIDSESEHIIQKATEKVIKGRTSIIIAHRLSTVREANRIILLDHGEIKEVGSHNELMEKKSFYYQLVKVQEEKSAIAQEIALI